MKTLGHNTRPYRLFTLFLTVFLYIATRCYHLVGKGKGLRISYDDDGQHIDIIRIELSERGKHYRFAFTPSLPDIADGGFRTSSRVEEYLLETSQLPIALV